MTTLLQKLKEHSRETAQSKESRETAQSSESRETERSSESKEIIKQRIDG